MKKSSIDNNIRCLSPSHPHSKSFKKFNTITSELLHGKKKFYEFSPNNKSRLNNNQNKLYKRYLFLKKIDLKDLSNKLYLEGINKIFNDEKIFFSKYYKNKRIIVGKSYNNSEIILSPKNDKKNSKQKQNLLFKTKDKNLSSMNNTFRTESIKTNSRNRKINNNYKRKGNYISDDDLKNIYQKWIEREKNNKNIKTNLKFSKINNNIKNDINSILNLQNLILNKRKEENNEMDKIEKKILTHTAKHRDKLLINQINDYRVKKEEIEEINKNCNKLFRVENDRLNNIHKNLQWLTSLRNYENNIIIRKPNKLRKRCISSEIFNNKNKARSFNSFDRRDVIFDLSGKSNSIYAQISPINNKENEKIRDTFNDFKSFSRNIVKNKEKKENNKMYKTNIFKGLNIQGKKLIDFEIELSKDLEGKKKRLVQIPYSDNEIKTRIFANSIINNNLDIPMTVKNTLELPYN